MKRISSLVAVAMIVAGAALAATPASAHHRPGPCDFHRLDGETVQHFSIRRIRCAVDRFGPVPGDAERAICIARRESGLLPWATSEPTGEYRGLFQHDRDLWPGRYDRYTKPEWELPRLALDGRSAAIVTIRMVADFETWLDAGWPPKDC